MEVHHDQKKYGFGFFPLMLIFVTIALIGLDIYVNSFEYFVAKGNFRFINKICLFLDRRYFFEYRIAYLLFFVAALLVAYQTRVKQSLKISKLLGILITVFAVLLLIFSKYIVSLNPQSGVRVIIYLVTVFLGIIFTLGGMLTYKRSMKNLMKDRFNDDQEKFNQEKRLIQNSDSVNIKTVDGWINIINPFRGTVVSGTPGSGKTYCVIEPYIKQTIEKGFAQFIYDYKFPDLTLVALNALTKTKGKGYSKKPKFMYICLDDVRMSHRINPISPRYMTNKNDCIESAKTILLNINKTWIKKEGEFFSDSAQSYFAMCIMALWSKAPEICTIPHAIQLACTLPMEKVFGFLGQFEELENTLAPFLTALENHAADQLAGQIASAQIGLAKIDSEESAWIFSGDEVPLQVNDPENPIILCIGNNPQREAVYSPYLGLVSTRIGSIINKKGQMRCAYNFDELPTAYITNLETIVATARSNKVAVCIGIQDFSQLELNFTREKAKVINNVFGNVISGAVRDQSAKMLQEMFGKIKQEKQSVSTSDTGTSSSLSTQLDYVIPQSKIASLSQGELVGLLTDNFDQRMSQKMFKSMAVIPTEKPIINELPLIMDISEKEAKELISLNYKKIKKDIAQLLETPIIEQE